MIENKFIRFSNQDRYNLAKANISEDSIVFVGGDNPLIHTNNTDYYASNSPIVEIENYVTATDELISAEDPELSINDAVLKRQQILNDDEKLQVLENILNKSADLSEYSSLGCVILPRNITYYDHPFNGFEEPRMNISDPLDDTPQRIIFSNNNNCFFGVKNGLYYKEWQNSLYYSNPSYNNIYDDLVNQISYKWSKIGAQDKLVNIHTYKVLNNFLTLEMINQPNTVYIIQYDYTLDSSTIEIPQGAVLIFKGGSIKEGTIIFNNNIVADEYTNYNNIFGDYLNIQGEYIRTIPTIPDHILYIQAGNNFPSTAEVGQVFFNTELNKLTICSSVDNTDPEHLIITWVDSDGNPANIAKKGIWANRPVDNIPDGFEYYCTDWRIPVYYNSNDDKWLDSNGYMIGKTPTPSIRLENNNLILITCDMQGGIENATIYYTIDGSTPTTNSAQYTHPLAMSTSTIIKAFAVESTKDDSDIAVFNYLPRCSAPVISQESNVVTMTSDTENAEITYTTDGTEPTHGSSAYTQPLVGLYAGTLIRAKAFAVGYSESLVTTFVVQTAHTL